MLQVKNFRSCDEELKWNGDFVAQKKINNFSCELNKNLMNL
jgi:hypothetical protein